MAKILVDVSAEQAIAVTLQALGHDTLSLFLNHSHELPGSFSVFQNSRLRIRR